MRPELGVQTNRQTSCIQHPADCSVNFAAVIFISEIGFFSSLACAPVRPPLLSARLSLFLFPFRSSSLLAAAAGPSTRCQEDGNDSIYRETRGELPEWDSPRAGIEDAQGNNGPGKERRKNESVAAEIDLFISLEHPRSLAIIDFRSFPAVLWKCNYTSRLICWFCFTGIRGKLSHIVSPLERCRMLSRLISISLHEVSEISRK